MNIKMKVATGIMAGMASIFLGANIAYADPNTPSDPCNGQPAPCTLGGAVQHGNDQQRQTNDDANGWNR